MPRARRSASRALVSSCIERVPTNRPVNFQKIQLLTKRVMGAISNLLLPSLPLVRVIPPEIGCTSDGELLGAHAIKLALPCVAASASARNRAPTLTSSAPRTGSPSLPMKRSKKALSLIPAGRHRNFVTSVPSKMQTSAGGVFSLNPCGHSPCDGNAGGVGCGGPSASAAFTQVTTSSMVTLPLPSRSPTQVTGHPFRAPFTAEIISSMVTTPSAFESQGRGAWAITRRAVDNIMHAVRSLIVAPVQPFAAYGDLLARDRTRPRIEAIFADFQRPAVTDEIDDRIRVQRGGDVFRDLARSDVRLNGRIVGRVGQRHANDARTKDFIIEFELSPLV